jgi:hypothetical protein
MRKTSIRPTQYEYRGFPVTIEHEGKSDLVGAQRVRRIIDGSHLIIKIGPYRATQKTAKRLIEGRIDQALKNRNR